MRSLVLPWNVPSIFLPAPTSITGRGSSIGGNHAGLVLFSHLGEFRLLPELEESSGSGSSFTGDVMDGSSFSLQVKRDFLRLASEVILIASQSSSSDIFDLFARAYCLSLPAVYCGNSGCCRKQSSCPGRSRRELL